MMMPNMGGGGNGMPMQQHHQRGGDGGMGGGMPPHHGGGGGGRGFGGGGRGRGGRGGGPKADAIKVTVTQVHHPVTESLIRQVFSTVENISPPLNIHVRPHMPGEEPVIAVVQFANPTDADVALKARNNCDIYTGCLHMTISFTRYDREVNNTNNGQQQQQQQQQQVGMPMGMHGQSTPLPQQQGMMGMQQMPQQMAMFAAQQQFSQMHGNQHQQHQQHQSQQQHQQGQQNQQHGHQHMQHQQQPPRQGQGMSMPGANQQPQYPSQQQQQFGQMSAPPQQSPQPQYMPQVGMTGMMPQHMQQHQQHQMQHQMGQQMVGYYPQPGQQMPGQQYGGGVPQQFPPMYGGGYPPQMMPMQMPGATGGRSGRGRGGRGGMKNMPGMPPNMAGHMGGMPMNFNAIAQAGPGGRGGGGANGANPSAAGGYTKPTAQEMETCTFLSIAMYPRTEPLIKLYNVLECWGGVVSLRRNQKNNDIIVAKMQSPADAQAICKHLNRVPLCGHDCSGRLFSTYTERNPPTNEGDPTTLDVTQFDFTTYRHRPTNLRCPYNVSQELLLSGCAQKSESEVMSYFSEREVFPESLTKIEEEGTFKIRMDSVGAAVSLLANYQWLVCDSEKANLVFCEETVANKSPSNERETNNGDNNKTNSEQDAVAEGAGCEAE